MKPYVFLDFDGVFNIWRTPALALPSNYDDWTRFDDVDGDDLWMSPLMAAQFTRAVTHADVFWLTQRLDDAPNFFAPHLQLPNWPWVDWQPTKTDAVAEQLLRDPRPFVWIDDDDADARELDVLKTLVDDLPPHLLVQPSTTVGLAPDSIEQVRQFVADHV